VQYAKHCEPSGQAKEKQAFCVFFCAVVVGTHAALEIAKEHEKKKTHKKKTEKRRRLRWNVKNGKKKVRQIRTRLQTNAQRCDFMRDPYTHRYTHT
jgi:hypothetical protein